MDIAEAIARLARIPVEDAQRRALEDAAATLEKGVTARLSQPPGDAHEMPWVRTGHLRDSLGHSVGDAVAVIGCTDPVAALQELGTARMPPRPFLGPTASELGPSLAQGIGQAIADALRQALTGKAEADPA